MRTRLKRLDSLLASAAVVATGLAMLALLSLLSGCSNSSGPDETTGYLARTSPENVLANLELAYNQRNLEEYLACMSEDFRFNFSEFDQEWWPDLPPWFYKSDEEQAQANMFGDAWDVESISLALEIADTETLRGCDVGVPTGDVVRLRVTTDLRVIMTSGLTYVCTDPEDFYFRPAAARAGRDDEWVLFEWQDQDTGEIPGCLEDAGWGGIKAHFLESLTVPSRRTTPEDVIEQLVTAYNQMDVDSYLDCLSEDFTFFPSEEDVNDPTNPLDPEWHLADETIIHQNMFDPGSNVDHISLTLTTSQTEHDEGAPGDPADDTWTYTENVDLGVHLYGGLILLATTPSEFHLRVDADEEGPYGELMWEVYEWYDIGPRGASRVEESTWGGIKAMFR